jgi:hypothetical protein
MAKNNSLNGSFIKKEKVPINKEMALSLLNLF